MGAVDPGDIHAGIDERRDEPGVIGCLTGQRHHDPGWPSRTHRPEDGLGVGVQDLVALVEGVIDLLQVPRAGIATQRSQHVAGRVHLGPHVRLGGRQ